MFPVGPYPKSLVPYVFSNHPLRWRYQGIQRWGWLIPFLDTRWYPAYWPRRFVIHCILKFVEAGLVVLCLIHQNICLTSMSGRCVIPGSLLERFEGESGKVTQVYPGVHIKYGFVPRSAIGALQQYTKLFSPNELQIISRRLMRRRKMWSSSSCHREEYCLVHLAPNASNTDGTLMSSINRPRTMV